MRKATLFLSLAIGAFQWCQAQTYLPDTIQINRTSTTYLIFSSKVALVDISPEYLVKIESGNIVFVRPRTTSARLSPILVRTYDDTFLGYLGVSDGTPPAFVDISKMQRPVETQSRMAELPALPSTGQDIVPVDAPNSDQLLASLNPTATITPIEKQPSYDEEFSFTTESDLKIRMDSLLSGLPQNFDQERNSGIVVKLTQLLHDSTNTYVELTVANKTAMPYLLDQVSFWYQNQAKKRKGVYLDGETYPMDPIFETLPDRVEADQKVRLRFVLPQFAPQSRSQFVVNILERRGTRNVTLRLPMKTVLYAQPKQPTKHRKEFRKERNKDHFSNLTWFWNEWKKKKA